MADEKQDEKKDEATSPEEPKEEPKDEPAGEPAAANVSSFARASEDKSEDEPVEVPAQFKKLVDEVEQMSVLELNELVKVLEKKFGVSASAVAVVAPGAAGGDGGDEEERSTFSVELTNVGGQKIAVIKAVKEILGLGLKDAKDMVDGAPSMLKEGVKKEEAEEIKKKIEEVGGTVTLK